MSMTGRDRMRPTHGWSTRSGSDHSGQCNGCFSVAFDGHRDTWDAKSTGIGPRRTAINAPKGVWFWMWSSMDTGLVHLLCALTGSNDQRHDSLFNDDTLAVTGCRAVAVDAFIAPTTFVAEHGRWRDDICGFKSTEFRLQINSELRG